VFCYADDLLLTSLTVTGLHTMIDTAQQYVSAHGLQFNPSKTQCITFGKHFFMDKPTCKLTNETLHEISNKSQETAPKIK
jgi:hypothetical protein